MLKRLWGWQFATFRLRLLCFLLALISFLLIAVYLAVDIANSNNARRIINDALDISANTLLRQIEIRSQHLIESTRLLSGDFAFKQAYFSRDMNTTESALENHRRRIGADIMMVANLQGDIMASTLPLESENTSTSNAHHALIKAAQNNAEHTAAMLVLINNTAYQLVAVPLLAPVPRGWFLVGFVIDHEFAERLEKDTHTHISVAFAISDSWQVYASTLETRHNQALFQGLSQQQWQPLIPFEIHINQQVFIVETIPMQADTHTPVLVVLQQSLDDALAPYQRTRDLLIVIFGGAFVLALAGGQLIAGTVTRPVKSLALFADEVNKGNYGRQLNIHRRDELGQLISSFNDMSSGLLERDQVRSLLGKVVSPQIAQELMQKKIELGGEEKEVTVLFSDLRGFTSLSETMAPKHLLELLNRYLSAMSQGIEAQGGVIDKYIGDAIMALFGAPLALQNAAHQAVQAALDMGAALHVFNDQLQQEQRAPMRIGIGINTDKVVAGNMGSEQRLNYTVIGDGVNLASRLEAITKYYGVPVIVSESTKLQAADFAYKEIDRVKVKGKQESVAIYTPICLQTNLNPQQQQELKTHHCAIDLYRRQQWQTATQYFQELVQTCAEQTLYEFYLQRIHEHQISPPGEDWDGAYVFQQK